MKTWNGGVLEKWFSEHPSLQYSNIPSFQTKGISMKLYTFFRSSASYRVRIALNLKGLSYETAAIHLRRGGGEHLMPAYKALNPQALVPTLWRSSNISKKLIPIRRCYPMTRRKKRWCAAWRW